MIGYLPDAGSRCVIQEMRSVLLRVDSHTDLVPTVVGNEYMQPSASPPESGPLVPSSVQETWQVMLIPGFTRPTVERRCRYQMPANGQAVIAIAVAPRQPCVYRSIRGHTNLRSTASRPPGPAKTACETCSLYRGVRRVRRLNPTKILNSALLVCQVSRETRNSAVE